MRQAVSDACVCKGQANGRQAAQDLLPQGQAEGQAEGQDRIVMQGVGRGRQGQERQSELNEPAAR